MASLIRDRERFNFLFCAVHPAAFAVRMGFFTSRKSLSVQILRLELLAKMNIKVVQAFNWTQKDAGLYRLRKRPVPGKIGGKNSSGAEAHVDSVGFMRGLKPPPPSVLGFSAACLAHVFFSRLHPPVAKQAAEKGLFPVKIDGNIPQGLKPALLTSNLRHDSSRALSKQRVFPQPVKPGF
jgi:hypothetical protein